MVREMSRQGLQGERDDTKKQPEGSKRLEKKFEGRRGEGRIGVRINYWSGTFSDSFYFSLF